MSRIIDFHLLASGIILVGIVLICLCDVSSARRYRNGAASDEDENSSIDETIEGSGGDLSSIRTDFQCKTGRYKQWMSTLFSRKECRPKQEKFDSCCERHDRCYVNRRGRIRCDRSFCECLRSSARGTHTCETVDAPAFCALVKSFGRVVYRRAGIKPN